MRYVVPLPAVWTEDSSSGRVHDYLVAQGVGVQGVAVTRGHGGVFVLSIESDADPSPFMANYTNAPSRSEKARQDRRAALQRLIDASTAKPHNTRTHGEQIVLSLLPVLRDLLGDDVPSPKETGRSGE